MKNILLITPLFPIQGSENRTTPVCHYFARDWKKLGYNVIVVHSQYEYPRIWHLLIKFFGKKINHRMDGIFYEKRLNKTEHYIRDDVPVFRMPLFKYVPGRIPTRSIKRFRKELNLILAKHNFVPNIIVGHMLNIDIIPFINKDYGARTCMVSHGEPIIIKRYPDYKELIESYDYWGFRSKAIQDKFENFYGKPRNTFICYSGIPENFITGTNPHKFDGDLKKYLYVGTFIQRKYPAVLPQAISDAHHGVPFSLTYIGEGPERDVIISEIKRLSLENNVSLFGKIPRDSIIEQYDNSDCMIMISRDEAYGLVYLEAMARGCIVIASRNEGIDGIIVDGENGFLCEAGNIVELTSIINRINKLSNYEKQIISDSAISTAKRFSDIKAASMYLKEIGYE